MLLQTSVRKKSTKPIHDCKPSDEASETSDAPTRPRELLTKVAKLLNQYCELKSIKFGPREKHNDSPLTKGKFQLYTLGSDDRCPLSSRLLPPEDESWKVKGPRRLRIYWTPGLSS